MHAVAGYAYQYARVKNTPIMALRGANTNFSQIFVCQNTDGAMNFIFMVKNSASYKPQSDEEILSTLKVSTTILLIIHFICFSHLTERVSHKSTTCGFHHSQLRQALHLLT